MLYYSKSQYYSQPGINKSADRDIGVSTGSITE